MGEILHFVDSPEDLGDAPDQPTHSGNLPPHTHLARDLWPLSRSPPFFCQCQKFPRLATTRGNHSQFLSISNSVYKSSKYWRVIIIYCQNWNSFLWSVVSTFCAIKKGNLSLNLSRRPQSQILKIPALFKTLILIFSTFSFQFNESLFFDLFPSYLSQQDKKENFFFKIFFHCAWLQEMVH